MNNILLENEVNLKMLQKAPIICIRSYVFWYINNNYTYIYCDTKTIHKINHLITKSSAFLVDLNLYFDKVTLYYNSYNKSIFAITSEWC